MDKRMARVSSTRPDAAADDIMVNELYRTVNRVDPRRGTAKFWTPETRHMVVENCICLSAAFWLLFWMYHSTFFT